MRFRELVGIMRADPPRLGIDQRQDRKLDEVEALDQGGEDSKLGRMNDVLRIVENDGLEPAALRRLRYYVANAPTRG